MTALALLGLLVTAQAQDQEESWTALHTGLLVESLYGDQERAIGLYSSLRGSLPSDDTTRTDALLLLGRAQIELGRYDDAQETFRECIRILGTGNACSETLKLVALEQQSVTSLPVVWTFDDRTHRLVLFSERGSLRLADDASNSVLVWTPTRGETRRSDILALGFRRPTPPPRELRIRARATGSTSLQPFVSDRMGHGFTLPASRQIIRLTTTFREYVIPLRDLEPVDRRDALFDPMEIHRIELRDVTALLEPGRYAHQILIDRLEIR